MNCPVHHKPMERARTRYGGRWRCTVEGCTVAAWEGGTSTPADDQTRAARKRAHVMFDALWQGGWMTRQAAYKWLSGCMGLRLSKAHIGMFTFEQCAQLIAKLNGMKKDRL